MFGRAAPSMVFFKTKVEINDLMKLIELCI
jgi:hypothetical protein